MAIKNLESVFETLTREAIEKKVSNEQLWIYYFGTCKTKQRVKVPNYLRDDNEDKNPSGSIIKDNRTNTYILYDHAYKQTYNIYTIIGKQFNLKYNEVLQKINKDFTLNIGNYNEKDTKIQNKMVVHPVEEKIKRFKSELVDITINYDNQPDKYRPSTLDYFKTFGISEETLRFFEVEDVTKYTLNSKDKKHQFFAPENCPYIVYCEYAYNIKHTIFDSSFANPLDGNYDYFYMPDSYKILNISSKTNKWVTNTTKYCISGIKQLTYVLLLEYILLNKNIFKTSNVEKHLEEYLQHKGLYMFCHSSYPALFNAPFVQSMIELHRSDNSLGYKNLVSNETLIITKSFKDMMLWWELGIPALALQSEYNDFPDIALLKSLNLIFSRIILNFDNDEVGRTNAMELHSKNISYLDNSIFLFPKEHKDITTFYKNAGKKAVEDYISQLL